MMEECKIGLDLTGNPRTWTYFSSSGATDVVPDGSPPWNPIIRIEWNRSESKPGSDIVENFKVTLDKRLELFGPFDNATLARFWKAATSRAFTYNGASFEIKAEQGGQLYRLLEFGRTKKTGPIEELALPGYPTELSFVEIPVELFIKQFCP